MLFKKQSGFTLIELLVVVLIIGILAAIAWPSYRKAVIKTRVMSLLPLLRSINDAQDRFFMQTGRYTLSFDALDIAMPAGGTVGSGIGFTGNLISYKDFSCLLRRADDSEAPSSYSAYCYSKMEGAPWIEKYYQRDYFVCWASIDNGLEHEICYDISGKTTPDGNNGKRDGFRF